VTANNALQATDSPRAARLARLSAGVGHWMIADYQVRLASSSDAADIAEMSRDFIEHGLGWGWTEGRVLKNIQDRSTNVVVIREQEQLFGFGIMRYADESAHLFLLGVHYLRRRRGVATTLVAWLEAAAHTAGIERIRLKHELPTRRARFLSEPWLPGDGKDS